MWKSAREVEGRGFQENDHKALEVQSSEEALRILIADDDPSVVRLLADQCARMGFHVDTASNGIQALLKAGRGKTDTMVIDVNMPEVDGLSVCAHLLEPDKTPINMIVISGSKDPEALERCEGFGVPFVRKGPNFWSDLKASLAEIHPHMTDRIQGSHAQMRAIQTRPRVLLIDDDNDTNVFLANRLEGCGLEVKYASDAQHGFQMACKYGPAVIVTDYFMPNGDAQYLINRLRTTPATESIPVVVLSGRKLSEMEARSLRREICGRPGAMQILRKSPDTEALFQTLKKFCGFEEEHASTIHLAGDAAKN